MLERRLTALIAASITLMALAILWNVFMRHRVPVAAPVRPPVSAVPDTATHTASDTATPRPPIRPEVITSEVEYTRCARPKLQSATSIFISRPWITIAVPRL